MAKKEILKPFIRSWEGGYVNHPNDKGGATKWGVTIGTFRAVYGKSKTVLDLKNMTESQWDYIFGQVFWNKCLTDLINNQSVANLVVDWYWGSGTTALKRIQRVLGVTPDGIFGAKTIGAINGTDASTLFAALWRARKAHFEEIARNPSQKVFLKGWLNRLNGIKFGRLVCNGGRVVMF